MSQNPANLTPMIRQYLEIKKNHQDAILFFRMGDFYEMFFEDALKASPLLEIALTSRNRGEENEIPFCGVPHHSSSSYIARLIQAGHKVAICEQMEDPQTAKGIVKREVVRVITPGLVLESESLQAKGNNYLASVAFHQNEQTLAWMDISTGEMQVAFFHDLEDFFSELHRREPLEILCSPMEESHPLLVRLKREFFKSLVQTLDIRTSAEELLGVFSTRFQDSWKKASLAHLSPLLERTSLRLLSYVHESLKTDLHHLHEVHWMEAGKTLILDAATIRNLELVRNLQEGQVWGTLFFVLDKTQTAMGARRLKNWILYPLASEVEIRFRQQGIAELTQNSEILSRIRTHLSSVLDLERLNSRVATSIAHARDLICLGTSLALLPALHQELEKLSSGFFQNKLQVWNDLESLSGQILKTLKEDAPPALKEGGLIREGILPELDELRDILQDGKTTLLRMEEEERQKTGISSLKVRYNRVFGYYIEVSHTRRDLVPAHYIRKQTLANAERYITPELKSYEDKVLGAEEKIRHLEYDYFLQLRSEIAGQSHEISRMAKIISELDALCSLAWVALENNYSCPVFVAGKEFKIEEGRHPVLEKLFPSNRFVPNDLEMNDEDCRQILITGPNMAGKSTVLRQVALIALMAHMGSYVPAKKVSLTLMDRIFTRIGASDNLSKNQSTFWVEMEETAHILKSATSKSLIVLDEIGRGTSTYDGVSVAWSVAEYLHDQIRAKTLFATHYHELTVLADLKTGIKNFNIAVKEWNGEILFLYRLIPGATNQSYGIQVAALAGLPSSVTRRAMEVLNELQQKGHVPAGSAHPSSQISLFPQAPHPVIQEIQKLNLENYTPLQALELLYDFQKKISSS